MSENWFDELADLCEVDDRLNVDRILASPSEEDEEINSDNLVLTDWFDLSGLSEDEEASGSDILDDILASQAVSNEVDEILANSSQPSPEAINEILRQIASQTEVDDILANSSQPSPQAVNDILRQIENQQIGGSVNAAFNQREIRERVSFSAVSDPAEFYINLMQILNRFAERGSQIARANDRIQFEINTLHTTHHVIFNYDGSNMINQLQQLLDRLVQSNEALAADNEFNFRLQVINNPFGGGKRKIETILDHELVNKKRCHLICPPEINQPLCFALSIAGLLNPSARDTELLNVAKNIHHQAGLHEQTPVSFSDVIRFENIVQRKIIIFYRSERTISKFESDFQDRSNPLFILLLNQHYYGIKNIKGFLGAKYFCSWCFTPYQNMNGHHCKWFCRVCNTDLCKRAETSLITCSDCNRICQNVICFQTHKTPVFRPQADTAVSPCEMFKKCAVCKCVYYIALGANSTQHVCPSTKCSVCKQSVVNDEHRCFIQLEKKDDGLTEKVVYYDTETFTDQNGVHTPFLICAKSDSGEVWENFGLDCIKDFIMQMRRPKFNNYTFVAHNARGFDAYIILRAMCQLKIVPKNILMQGCKILSFNDPDFGLRFIDSLSFLMMKLANLPAALGFTDKTKGYFPHRFSSLEHLHYKGPYPAVNDYGFEQMSPEHKTIFLEWYNDVTKQQLFDFKKEAMFYCMNDVEILRKACGIFREEFFNETGIDPLKSVTIASACMRVFRSKFLKPDTLAIPCPLGYRPQQKPFSSSSIVWLEWLSHSQNVNIQHALTPSGEHKVGSFVLDGYAVISGVEQGFEFMGCFFHGCPKCFLPSAICSLRKITFGEIYDKTIEKLQTLETVHRLKMNVIWEHDWQQMIKTDPNVKHFVSQFEPPPAPLSPREALYGGRTCPVQLRRTAQSDEKIHYVDFTSLYPYVNATQNYPIGHPKIHVKNFRDPSHYFGLIKAVVSPPRKLFFPVLPFKTSKGKLVFTLCRTCAEMNNQFDSCSHSASQRALTGVWVSVELNYALEAGYRLVKMIEVWDFEKRSKDVFAGYINTFLKQKQQASGFPEGLNDDESKRKYVQDYNIHQGVQLDVSKIQRNPAKRAISKLCLNSLWGKFGQRDDLVQTTFVQKPDEFFNLLFSGKHDVKFFSFVTSGAVMVQHSLTDNCLAAPGRSNNIFIAAFTTAHARLQLLNALNKLGNRVIYYDTDSIIYSVKQNEFALPTGSYLGDLTDELSGDSIQEFVSAGPKTYAYKTRDRQQVVIKAKGITQSFISSDQINFDSLAMLVEGYIAGGRGEFLQTQQEVIKRDKRELILSNVSFVKRFRVIFDKRRLFADGTTEPFGY
uniref:DNA-directed DNA polymerase n=1 Tax=Nothobranchius rachovii TaxID=451742 RepID=A0A1A8SMB5_9TELE